MINQVIENMMTENRSHFLIPGDMIASVSEDNSLRHAFLVLTKVRYAKIPVLDNQDHFKGLISLPQITDKMLGLDDITAAPLDQYCVKDVMETGVVTIDDPYDIEEVLHALVDSAFLPVVQKDGTFTGIVTRREVMKGINYIGHNIDKEYTLSEKTPELKN
ncbi:MAG: CBS domain-containing protein [Lactobacillus sp.]|uniref:Cyclic-di-AMP-binding protein CbpB n=1 Tax=Lacticaseibacillus suilingensis TaxID=2799577 RepID=A0ABW4BL21_9LACO|nr:cyclic-di-AMP-binding protein CbpB [Lacticaseibacillus suilingensis]MCI1893752.1 CBS domain-containing protein [Lactobacillus sp.]MCI1916698.1 CBS domain-containing protein [Lactobacillus sp.]MCI1941387.1 CBS domain-containing protein [Lactobacillus sp.]MCI1971932.1 CBS domain-containing protein [Lactobacillus sp.]MCI2017677.1 CBS domain-containing protein [Lactobacillus sp.]